MAIFHRFGALLALALAAGCGSGARAVPGPLDRFTFPTGLAIAPLPGGGRALVVVSSNFDLRYSPQEGGSVLVVDPDRSSGDSLAVLGAARIPSFGGEVAVLASAPAPSAVGAPAERAACPGYAGGWQVLVPSRQADSLYRLELGTSGALSCGAGCAVPLEPTLADPYAVQVVCRTAPATGTLEATAWVSHLRTPSARGWLSRLDLLGGELSSIRIADPAPPTGSFAWDPARDRLFFTGRFQAIGLAPLHWLDLAVPGQGNTRNLSSDIRGAELRSIALSSDGTRAYLAVRLFDLDVASSVGVRTADTGGAIAVVDVTDRADGQPAGRLLRLVPVGVGPSEVEVLPRGDGRRDVVAVSSTDDGTVSLYDDESGAVAAVLSRDASNARLFGEKPFGLASESIGPRTRRLYVGSFDRGFVRAVDVDLDDPARPRPGARFGAEVPR